MREDCISDSQDIYYTIGLTYFTPYTLLIPFARLLAMLQIPHDLLHAGAQVRCPTQRALPGYLLYLVAHSRASLWGSLLSSTSLFTYSYYFTCSARLWGL